MHECPAGRVAQVVGVAVKRSWTYPYALSHRADDVFIANTLYCCLWHIMTKFPRAMTRGTLQAVHVCVLCHLGSLSWSCSADSYMRVV